MGNGQCEMRIANWHQDQPNAAVRSQANAIRAGPTDKDCPCARSGHNRSTPSSAMNPFGGSEKKSSHTRRWRLNLSADLVLVLICLMAGLALAAWRAKVRMEGAQSRARTDALAVSAALELQLHEVATTAELLAALGNQTPGATSGFQRVVREVLTTPPASSYLEWAPRGIVSEMFPPAGNERTVGFNYLRDPLRRNRANAGTQM